jgi:hypothetical protein
MMMMRVVIKQVNMEEESKIRIVCILFILLTLSIYTSCGFKHNVKRKLPKETNLDYRIIYDTIINRMLHDTITGPFRIESAIQHVRTKELELEVHSHDKKFVIKVDTSYNIIKWSRFEELY